MGIKRAEFRKMISSKIRRQAQEGETQDAAERENLERTEIWVRFLHREGLDSPQGQSNTLV